MYNHEQQQFTRYLKKLGFTADTIVRYNSMLRDYLEWEETLAEAVAYKDLLDFVIQLQELGKSNDRVNKHLLVVRHYLNMQIDQGKRDSNPAAGFLIKDYKIKSPNYLSRKELDSLLETYTGKRWLLLSLIVYQGLSLGNLERLQTIHLNLEKGTIYVPRGNRLKSRILPLQANQVVPLMELRQSKEAYLFTPRSLKNVSYWLTGQLKELNPKVQHLQHLRASVIVDWLKTKNLREVQYLAGHGHILSTEKYLSQDLKSLTESIERCHPLR